MTILISLSHKTCLSVLTCYLYMENKTHKEPHEGEYGEERDNEDEENDEVAKGCIALKSESEKWPRGV